MGTATFDFTGETAIVTGGSSGIGRAVARRFGEAGATVVVADVREAPKGEGDPTHEVIADDGGEAVFVESDVSDREDVETAVEAAREFGGVDVMVNNAGIHRGGLFLDSVEEDFEMLFDVNVKGVFHGTQVAALDMIERGEAGAVVNTASISSTIAQVGQSMYNATKAGVKMLTQNAAIELAQEDIRVNAVAPGAIETEIGGGTRSRSDRERPDVGKQVPMPGRAAPAEIAGLYLTLASDEASFVTGELLYADGGYTAL
ncbi:MAG: SDR family NAD(P)-dependent oxidoreductase [Halobacteriaceae archaeon]